MGYTHYWYLNNKGNQEKYNEALKLIKQIIKDNKSILAGFDGGGKPEITATRIAFNGKKEEAHETFSLPIKLNTLKNRSEPDKDIVFQFCKTAHQPYDIVVTQCLVVLKHFMGNDIEVNSDGMKEGFEEALQILNERYASLPLLKDLNIGEFKNPVTEE